MASSGSANYTVTAANIIQDALEELGVIGAGQTIAAEDNATALRALNVLTKQFMGPTSPVATSLRMWKRKRLTIDLTSTNFYVIQLRRVAFTSGGTTELTAGTQITGATGGATAKVMSIEVTSGTWAGGDAAGEIFLCSQVGTFQSENLNITGTNNIATIAADSTVYAPIQDIVDAVRRTSGGEDTPMSIMTKAEYMALSDKDVTGTPTKVYHEKRKDENRIYLNTTPSTTTDFVVVEALLPIEDFDATTNNPDFPAEWFRPLKWNLAKELLAKFPCGKQRAQTIIMMATESLAIANSFEPEDVTVFFEPNKD